MSEQFVPVTQDERHVEAVIRATEAKARALDAVVDLIKSFAEYVRRHPTTR